MKKEFEITVYKTDEEDHHQTNIAIMCSPATLIAGLSEVILNINDTLNKTGKLPYNFLWTMVAETVGDDLLERAEDK